MEASKIKKNTLAITGMYADLEKANVAYQMMRPTLPCTIGFQFYCNQLCDTGLFNVGEELAVKISGGKLHVFYNGASLFITSSIQQNILLWNVNTVDICCQEGETELYINGTLTGSSKTKVTFPDQEEIRTVFGGGDNCYLRWFRVYDVLLTKEQIGQRQNGMETKNSGNIDKLPAVFLDFTNETCSGQFMFQSESMQVALTECLRLEPGGVAMMMPDRAIFHGNDGSLILTVRLPYYSDQEEYLFSSGSGDEAFSLLIRRVDGNAYLDVGLGKKRSNGTHKIPLNVWVDLAFVKQGDKIRTYINGECDQQEEAALPAGALQAQPSWYFGNHTPVDWNSFSGYISYFSVLDVALTDNQVTEALHASINRYSGNVFCACGFHHYSIYDLQPSEIFMNKNASFTVLREQLSGAELADQVVTLFVENSGSPSVPLSRRDKEKALIALEFSAQVFKEAFGAELIKPVEEVNDAQLALILPYADEIGEVYKSFSSVFEGFGVETDNTSNPVTPPAAASIDLKTADKVLTGVAIAGAICGIAGLVGVFLAGPLFAAFAIGAAAAHMIVTIGTITAIVGFSVMGAAIVLDKILFNVYQDQEASPGPGSTPETGPTPPPTPGPGKYALKVSLDKAYFAKAKGDGNPAVYMKEHASEQAPEEEWTAARNNETKPAKLCLIRADMKDGIPMVLNIISEESEPVDGIVSGTLYYNDLSAEVELPDQGKVKIKTGANRIPVTVKLPESMIQENKSCFYFKWKIREDSSVLRTRELQVPHVDAYILDQRPLAPWEVTSRENTICEKDLMAYTSFYNQCNTLIEYVTAFSGYWNKTYSITQSAASSCTVRGGDGTSAIFCKPIDWDSKTKTLNSLDCAAILTLCLALGGYSVRIVGIETAMPALQKDQKLTRFPLSLRNAVYPSASAGEEIEEYYAVEARADDNGPYLYFDIFSKDTSLNGKCFDKGIFSDFCATDVEGKDTYRSLLVNVGTTAVLTERFSKLQMVSTLPEPVTDEGVGSEDEAVCVISLEEGVYHGAEEEMEYDRLVRYCYHQESFSLFRVISQAYIVSCLTDLMNMRLEESVFCELLEHLYGAVRPKEDYVDLLLDRYNAGALYQMDLLKQMRTDAEISERRKLATVNRLLSNLLMIKENIRLAYFGKQVDRFCYYPCAWFYYSDSKVWASNQKVFEAGVDYERFHVMCGAELPWDIRENGIYLMEQSDYIRNTHLVALQEADFKVPKVRQCQGSFLHEQPGQPSSYIYVDTCRNYPELDQGVRRICRKAESIYGINADLQWKKMAY